MKNSNSKKSSNNKKNNSRLRPSSRSKNKPKTLITPDIKAIITALLPDETRIVGGAVRDFIQGIKLNDINDIDIATSATPEIVTARLTDKLNAKVIPTGIKHGTVTVIYNHKNYEITTLRKDLNNDGRHATVVFTKDFKEDAARRDFTFNALYMDINEEVYDFFYGKTDLKVGQIRFIGEAELRIQEDYLRILRFFRFYGKISNPANIDTSTIQALKQQSVHLTKLSTERITSEFIKIINTPYASSSLKLMQNLGILTSLNLEKYSLNNFKSYQELVKPFTIQDESLVKLYCLYKDNKDLLNSQYLKFSRSEKKFMQALSKESKRPKLLTNFQHHTYWLGKELYISLLYIFMSTLNTQDKDTIQQSKSYLEIINNLQNFKIPTFPITGAEVMDLGIPQGKKLGQLLDKVEQWWVAEDFPNKEATLEFLTGKLK